MAHVDPPRDRPLGSRPRGARLGAVACAVGLAVTAPACSLWETGFDFTGTNDVPATAFGMRPVYIDAAEAQRIYSDAPRPLVNSTGIVLAGDRLFIVDLGTGLHVLDNADPRNPVTIAFIHVPGITTAAFADGRLYVDNFGDLVTLDVSDPSDVRVVDRDPGLFPRPLDYPVGHFGFFECYDPARGFLVGWEQATLERPHCRI